MSKVFTNTFIILKMELRVSYAHLFLILTAIISILAFVDMSCAADTQENADPFAS